MRVSIRDPSNTANRDSAADIITSSTLNTCHRFGRLFPLGYDRISPMHHRSFTHIVVAECLCCQAKRASIARQRCWSPSHVIALCTAPCLLRFRSEDEAIHPPRTESRLSVDSSITSKHTLTNPRHVLARPSISRQRSSLREWRYPLTSQFSRIPDLLTFSLRLNSFHRMP